MIGEFDKPYAPHEQQRNPSHLRRAVFEHRKHVNALDAIADMDEVIRGHEHANATLWNTVLGSEQ